MQCSQTIPMLKSKMVKMLSEKASMHLALPAYVAEKKGPPASGHIC